jgi:hypothetical protein
MGDLVAYTSGFLRPRPRCPILSFRSARQHGRICPKSESIETSKNVSGGLLLQQTLLSKQVRNPDYF